MCGPSLAHTMKSSTSVFVKCWIIYYSNWKGFSEQKMDLRDRKINPYAHCSALVKKNTTTQGPGKIKEGRSWWRQKDKPTLCYSHSGSLWIRLSPFFTSHTDLLFSEMELECMSGLFSIHSPWRLSSSTAQVSRINLGLADAKFKDRCGQ